MDKFLERHKLLKLSQEEIDDLNSPMSIKVIESEFQNYPAEKTPDPGRFIGDFSHDITPILCKLFQKMKMNEYFLIHSKRPALL